MVQRIRTVIYSRVSTDAQERDGTSLDTQERACLEYAEAGRFVVIDSIRDTASGFSLDRPGVERVRQLLKQGAVDVVVAYAVDRLSRNQNHIGVLFDEVEQSGARLEFVTENFEDTAIGRFILAARAFIAEVEREKIAERTMRGKAERARSGKIPQGTGKGIYGYRYDRETGRREVNDDEASVVQRIFGDFCDSTSCNRIANQLNQEGIPAFGGGRWHPLTVRRMLLNETYTGQTVYRRTKAQTVRDSRTGKKKRQVTSLPETEWIEVPGATPPLISQTTFDKAQSILNDPERRLRGQPTQRFRLRGHIRCLKCGTPMVGQAQAKRRYPYYRCRRSYSGHFDGKCDSRYIKTETLEGIVLEQIAQLLSDPHRILEETRRLNDPGVESARIEVLNRELEKVEERQRRLARLYVDGSIPEDILSIQSEALTKERMRLESERRSLAISTEAPVDLDRAEQLLPEAVMRLREWVLGASKEDMELILRALAIQVRASSEEVQIEGTVPLSIPEEENLVTIVQTSA